MSSSSLADLERLTEPFHGSEAYESCGEDEEGSIEVGVSFVADDETPELVDPGEGALDDPAVSSEALTALDAAAGDAWHDPTGAEVPTAAFEVVALVVGVELGGTFAGASSSLADGVDGVDRVRQGHAVVPVGARQGDGEGQACPIHDEVALGAGLAAVRGVRARRVAPLLAGTDEASSDARDQSIRPARFNRSSMWRWRRSHKPMSCQARRRRQHVIPEQPATSNGSRSQPIAVYKTNRMPVSASRLPTGGRPPFGRAASCGNKGEISSQSASGRSFLAMPDAQPNMVNKRFC